MKKVYITFGGSGYEETVGHTVENAPRMGADEVWVYDDLWLTKTEFYQRNRWLWSIPPHRGFGWYAWKPFIILDALSKLADGDIVLYTDGDTYPIHDFSVLYDECKRIGGVMLFKACGQGNAKWTKRDCYIVMGQDANEYWSCQHVAARFMLFQKGPWHVQQFLMEWQTYCLNPYANTLIPSILNTELSTFVEHRSDQSILTLLAHKYGHRLYREACQFGEPSPEDKDIFPTLFHQIHAHGAKGLGSRFANVPERWKP